MEKKHNQILTLQNSIFSEHELDLKAIGGAWLQASLQEMATGMLRQGSELFSLLKGKGWDQIKVSMPTSSYGLPICLATKVIERAEEKSTKVHNSLEEQISAEIIADFQAFYYIPALLTAEGRLMPGNWQWPWFDRQVFGSELSLIINDYISYTKARNSILKQIPDWKTWLSLSFDLYQQVLKESFTESSFKHIKFSPNFYVLPDDIARKKHILYNFYSNLSTKKSTTPLVEKMLTTEETEKTKRRWDNDFSLAFAHSAYITRRFSLATSHRRVVEQLLAAGKGEITTINSPLGTKPELVVFTTIASRLVNAAVLGEKPPLSAVMVSNQTELLSWTKLFKLECVSSSGEQDVLNILGHSWIGGSRGFGAALIDECETQKFVQAHLLSIGYSKDLGLEALDNPRQIKEITEHVIEQCSKYFSEKITSLEKCRTNLHETLISVDFARQSLLQTSVKIKEFMGRKSVSQDQLFYPEEELREIRDERDKLHNRFEAWQKHFKALPLPLRIGANTDLGKIKVSAYYEAFRSEQEMAIMPTINSIDDVEKALGLLDRELAEEEEIIDEIARQVDKTERMIKKLGKIGLDIELMGKYISQPDRINLELDQSLRLLSFWLAVHYYECRWLAGESIVLAYQKNRRDEDAAKRYLDRLSLISPCLVAEASSLLKVNGLGINSIGDLFILDAQDKKLAEILPLLTKAKRLHVLGDPSISQYTDFFPLDQPWTKDTAATRLNDEATGQQDETRQLEKETAKREPQSENQEMDLLARAGEHSTWQMFNRHGMWLSDNLTNFEEISNYGNFLYFDGKLQSARGLSSMSGRRNLWPPMSLWQVDLVRTEKYGLDSYQNKEIEEIIRWLNANYESIRKQYIELDQNSQLAIVTATKAQQVKLQEALTKEFRFREMVKIKVATPDQFVTLESYPLVLYSAVYAAETNKDSVYDLKHALIYKAISLAEDVFIYFGDAAALPAKGHSPAAQLRRRLKPLNRKKI